MKVIQVFLMLLSNRSLTIKEIADRCEVSYRTALRDVKRLSLYCPVCTLQGKRGGGFLMPEYKKELIKNLNKM